MLALKLQEGLHYNAPTESAKQLSFESAFVLHQVGGRILVLALRTVTSKAAEVSHLSHKYDAACMNRISVTQLNKPGDYFIYKHVWT